MPNAQSSILPFRLTPVLDEAPSSLLKEAEQLTTGQGNLLIHGDNLPACQLLLPYFSNRIQCIYIDPPYNTGHHFAHYADEAGQSEWLGFMETRLSMLRRFLKEEGVILVSIDDAHYAPLKILMDNVFGADNYCGTLVWEKKRKPSFLDRNLGSVTEFILAFAKDRLKTGPFIGGKTEADKHYPLHNQSSHPGILEFAPNAIAFGCADGIYPAQDMSTPSITSNLLDTVTVQNGRNLNAFRMQGCWRYSQKRLNDLMQAGARLEIRRYPFRPTHCHSGGQPKKLKNLLTQQDGIPTYEDAAQESRALFGAENAFEYPKPEKLMGVLINAVTRPNDWVMDAFAGSGTTGAVAHKLGRRWIMIEQGEQCRTHILPRMQRVIAGTDPGGISKEAHWQGGSNFQHLQVSRLD